MKSIAVGAAKRAGKTWFPELSDKIVWFFLLTNGTDCFIHYRKKYKNSFVLLYEELWRIAWSTSCKHSEYCRTLSGVWTKILYIILRLTVDILQGRHLNCSTESACKKEGYFPSKVQLRDPGAIAVYTKKLKETLIYRNADSYCHVSDSFNIFLIGTILLVHVVSWHILGWIFQSSTSNICTQAYPFWYRNFHYENEFSLYGLG